MNDFGTNVKTTLNGSNSTFRWRRAKNRRGGATMSLTVATVGALVFSTYLINVGRESMENIRMQNAADSAAYASALWMARGMNATASLNHAMGENTGYDAVIEALAGPEIAFKPCDDDEEMEKRLKSDLIKFLDFKTQSPKKTNGNADTGEKELVEKTIKTLTDHSKVDKIVASYPPSVLQQCGLGGATTGLRIAGGACYDAELLLKCYGVKQLTVKAIGTVFLEGFEYDRALLGVLEIPGGCNHYSSNIAGYGTDYLADAWLDKLIALMERWNELIDKAKGAIQDINTNMSKILNQLTVSFDAQFSLRMGENIEWLQDLGQFLQKASNEGLNVTQYLGEGVDVVCDNLQQMQQTIKTVSAEVVRASDELKKLKTRLEKLNERLDRIIGNNEVSEALDEATKEVTDQIKRVYKEIERQNAILQKGVAKLKEIEEKIKEYEKKINDAIKMVGSVGKLLEQLGTAQELLVKISGSLTLNLKKFSDEMSAKLNELCQKLDQLKLDGLIDALKNKFGLEDLLNSVSALGTKGFMEEMEEILDLELTLGKNSFKDGGSEGGGSGGSSAKGSHDARRESRANIDKMNARFPNVVGSDKEKPEERQLYKRIYATCDELRDVYGFDNCVVAPMDTLVSEKLIGASNESSDRTSGDAPARAPLLPVLAEESSTVLKTNESASQQWNGSCGSAVDELPEIPWKGDYNDDKIPAIYKANDMLIIAGQVWLAAYIAMKIAQWDFGSAAKGSELLGRTIALELACKTDEWAPGTYCHPNSPSVWNYPRKKFDYDKEKISQWTRATYPVADDLCGRMAKKFKKDNPASNIATFLTAWTWRCALSESYYNRTGSERPYGVPKTKSCHMYVIAGTEADNKGNEKMWSDRDFGAPIIDEMFSVAVSVQAKKRPAIASLWFRRQGENHYNTIVAQAAFYSATGRNSNKDGTLRTNDSTVKNPSDLPEKNCQPCTGWDTLQWKNSNVDEYTKIPGPPVFKTKEWSNPNPSTKGDGLDYEGLVASSPRARNDADALQFNWQAMLCPITESRAKKLAADKNANDDLKKTAETAAKHARLFTF